MRRGHIESPRWWLCLLMLLAMWVQALVNHFVLTSHLVINILCFRSILDFGLAGLSPANASSISRAPRWCRRGVTLGTVGLWMPSSQGMLHPFPVSLLHWPLVCLADINASACLIFLRPSSWKLCAVITKAVVFSPGVCLIWKVGPAEKYLLSQLVEFPHLRGAVGIPWRALAQLLAQADLTFCSPAGLKPPSSSFHALYMDDILSSHKEDNSVLTKRMPDISSNEQKW